MQGTPSSSARANRRARITRTALFGAAAALGLISAWGWRFQRPWADPAHPPRGLSRFFAPIETNAWMRLGSRGSGFAVGPAYGPREPQRSPIEDFTTTDTRVFVAFNDGTIARYSDEDGWRQTRLDVPRWPGPMSMVFLGELEGYAVAGTGAVFRTSDGGERWEKLTSRETLPPLLAIDAYPGALWALAEQEALLSRDRGQTWIHFDLPKEGWLVGQGAMGGRTPPPAARSWLMGATPGAPDPYRPSQPAAYPAAKGSPAPPPVAQPKPQPPPQPQVRLQPNPPPDKPDAPADGPGPAPAAEPPGRPRAQPPAGPYQVCATPTETYLITPAASCTVYTRAGEDSLQPTPVGPSGVARCVRSRWNVIGLIGTDGGYWRRHGNSEAFQRVDEPSASTLVALDPDANRVFVAGHSGFTAWAGGPTPPPFPWKRELRRVASNHRGAWMLDEDDSLWRADSPDGPWRRAIAFRSSITAAAEPRRDILLAATSTGLVLRSEDRGESWSVESALDRPVGAFTLAEKQGRWAAVPARPPPLEGWLERPGGPWEKVALADDPVLQSPHPDRAITYPPLNDLAQALSADESSPYARSAYALRTSAPPSMVTEQGATALYLSGGSPSTVWGVGPRCRILMAFSPYSRAEERTAPGCTAALRDIAVVGDTGWAVGDYGTVLRSSDGGHTWTRVNFPSQAGLTSVIVSDGGARVTVLGDGDTIRVTRDGGERWSAPQNHLYPAPWCLLACALSLVLGGAGMRLKVPPEVVGTHIEDLLASDAPITDERQDVLGQAQVARTVAYFLQNDRTEAPLTLAVTGEWGTGKSSVLNLVRKRLSRSGMPVIDFNAWHHQGDADPLAALFASIVKGAVPRGLARVEYRARLLVTRWRQRAWMLGLIALLTTFLLGLYVQAPHYAHDAFRQVAPVVQCYFGADCPQPEARDARAVAAGENPELEKAHSRTFWGGGLATLVVVAPMLVSLFRSLRSFGVKPSALVSAVSGGLRASAEKERLDFHTQFADEFDDVTAALGRRRLVLLIDDLDRCTPGNLLRVLEALNFIVSSGKCFVVLAMSRGVVLESLASELPASGGVNPADRADRYLQKLINVEVALPQLSPKHGLTLITGAGARAAAEEPPERTAVSRAAAWGLAAGLALAIGSIAFSAGAWLGQKAEGTLVVSEAPAEQPPEALAAAGPSSPSPGKDSRNRGEKSAAFKADKADAARPATGWTAPAGPPAVPVKLPERWSIEPPEPPSKSLWAVVPWLLLVAAGLLALAVSSSPRPMTTDSRDFRDALERWSEVIQLRQATPRALKRFLNRLRFWAMRLRAEREPLEPVSPWQRLFSRGPQARGQPDTMSEAALVALAALHELRPELVVEPDRLAKALEPEDPRVRAALEAERKASGHPTEEDRRRFLDLLGTVQMGG